MFSSPTPEKILDSLTENSSAKVFEMTPERIQLFEETLTKLVNILRKDIPTPLEAILVVETLKDYLISLLEVDKVEVFKIQKNELSDS